MIRKTLLAAVGCVLLATSSQAALIGTLIPDLVGAPATDGSNALTIDTYKFDVENTSDTPLLAVEMSFSGTFYDIPSQNATFRATPMLPTFFGQNIPDSFFIGGGTQLVGASEDTTSVLSGAWTYPQSAPIIEGNSTATLAYLTVPTGTAVEFGGGRGTYDLTSYEDITPGGPSVGIEAMYVGPGTSLSEGLQGAFGSRGYGPIVLSDAIMIGNIGGELSGLDPLTVDVVGAPDFATVSVEDLDGDGKYDITIDADFASLDPGTAISGEIVFATGAEGADPNAVGFGFRVAVPEPSTIALSGLALLGLVGFARRR